MSAFRRIAPCSLLLALFWIVLVSCPNPLNKTMLLQVKDKIGPTITIVSPPDGSSYAATIVVTGIVRDSSTASGEAGKISSLFYEVLATTLGNTVPFGEDGSFSFQFSTANLTGTLVLRITAEDWQGNVGTASLTLVDAGSDIPSFRVQPGNHQVIFSWDAVPLAVSYSLHYTTNNSIPSAINGVHIEGVSSPYVLSGLNNGVMHIFLLQARSSEGEDNWSAPVYAIPLSSFSLVPKVHGEYRKIVLEWPDIPGTDEYEVLRATDRDGDYITIAGTVRADSFEDVNVEDHRDYFYRIRPSLPGSIASFPAWTTTSLFPPGWVEYTWCLSQPFNLNVIDGMAAVGDYLYVTMGGSFWGNWSRLAVYDISNPSQPVAKGSVNLTTAFSIPGRDVVVRDAYAFVAGPDKLYIVDVSDPDAPFVAGSCQGFTEIQGVDVNEDCTYVADGSAGVRFVDITSISNPSIIDTCDTSGFAYDVAYRDDRLYVADGTAGMQVIDAVMRSIVATIDTAGEARAIAIDAFYAYVADYDQGLSVIGLYSSYIQGSCDTPGNALDVSLSGQYALVSDENAGLQVIDISLPSHPSIAGHSSASLNAVSVVAKDQDVFVSDTEDIYGILKGFHLSDLHPRPVMIESIPIDAADDLVINESYIVAVSSTGDLQIIDRQNKSLLGNYENPNPMNEACPLVVRGTYAFLSHTDGFTFSRFEILDISDTSHLDLVSSMDFSTPLWCRDVQGDYAYLVGYSGLTIVDISEPVAPRLAGSVIIPGTAFDAAVRGRHAYLTAYTGGLQIVDVSEPAIARIVSSYRKPSELTIAMHLQGNYVYLGIDSDPNDRICVVDVGTPERPMEIASCPMYKYPSRMTASGHWIFAMEGVGGSGFQAVDTIDPTAPYASGAVYSSVGYYSNCAIDGRFAYVGCEDIIEVFDLLPE